MKTVFPDIVTLITVLECYVGIAFELKYKAVLVAL